MQARCISNFRASMAVQLGFCALLAGCSTDGAVSASEPTAPTGRADAQQAQLSLWATNYYVHAADRADGGVALRTMDGIVLDRISPKNWCAAAIEGTVAVTSASGSTIYNYAGKGTDSAIDCRPYISSHAQGQPWAAALGRTRWAKVSAPYGLGVDGYKLVPFVTVAVDRNTFPIGTVLYIPDAKGVSYRLPDGETRVHDGYFFAADVGGAIRGNHIDVFTGLQPNRVFSFIKSRPSGTFAAQVNTDPSIRQRLRRLHQ